MKTKPATALAVIGSALSLLAAASAQAQTTYTGNATADTNSIDWDAAAANWSASPAISGSQTGIPGSLKNGDAAVNDIVILRNERSAAGDRYWDLDANLGQIGQVTIGSTGTRTEPTRLRANAGGNITIGAGSGTVVTLGAVNGTSQRPGQLHAGNNNTGIITVNGDIVRGSTSGTNNIVVNSSNAAANDLILTGGIDPAGGNFIDLAITRGSLGLTGAGAQALNVQSFDLVEAGDTANITTTWTLPDNKTLNASDIDVARNTSSGTQAARVHTATWNILGGASSAGEVRVGNVGNANTSNTQQGIGTINIGGADGGSLTINGELRLGVAQPATALQTANGTVTVSHADSIVTLNNGLELAINNNSQSTSGIFTLNSGLVQLTGNLDGLTPIGTPTAFTARLDVLGGEFILKQASPTAPVRGVNNLNFTGGKMDFMLYGGMPALATTDTALAAAAGGSVIDLSNGSDAFASTTETATWDGGGGDSNWDTGPNWNNNFVPAQGGAIVPNGASIQLVTSTNAITGNPAAATLGTSDGGWSLAQNANDITVTRTGATFGAAVAKAVIDTAVTVNRGSDLNIQNAGGQGAEASGLLLSAGTLNLTGGSSLILGGAGAVGDVTQSGSSDLNISGNLLFGGPGGTQGGTYDLDGGSLDVTGDIIEDSAATNNAQLHIDGGTLTVAGGDITVQRFAVGQKLGTTGSHALTAGQTLTTTGTLSIGANGTGTLTATNATIAVQTNYIGAEFDGSSSLVTLNGSTTMSVGTVFEIANDAGQTGTFTMNGTSSVTHNGTDDFRIADNGIGILNMNDSSSLTHSGGNFEIAETASGNGTLNMNTTGTLSCRASENFILGQSAGATVALNLTAGTIDATPDAATNTNGNVNCNGGIATVTMTGGTIKAGEDLLFGNNAASVLRWNQSGGQVLINDAIDYRDNGDDQMVLSGTATVKLGQESGRGGNLNINNVSTAGPGGNVLTIKGSGVTFEMTAGTTNNFIADTDATLNWEFNDTGISPIVVGGTVTLNFAYAIFTHVGTTPPNSGEHTLFEVAGTNPASVIGQFTGLLEGAVITVAGQQYQLSYAGGDGNDVTLTPLNDPVVTIVKNGDVAEGAPAGWTLTANPAPSGGNIVVDLTYAGTAIAGSDYTGVASVSILDGSTTAVFNVPTLTDGSFEGCETIIASIAISGTSPVDATIGAPSSSTVTLFDGNVAPTASNLAQTVIDAGATVSLTDIVVNDPDADYNSKVNTTGEAFYYYSGASNISSFLDGRANDDFAFDIDNGFPTLSEPAGFSMDIDFIPQAADLTGTVMVWEIGGTSNGTSIHLVEGIPHLLVKCTGVPADVPVDDDANPANGIRDVDWAGNTICIPLGAAGSVVAGIPSRFAVVFDIVGNSMKFSVNGAAQQSETLVNNDSNNWRGDHTVANAQISGGIGAATTTAGSPFLETAIKNFSGGTGAVPSVRFWNESGGSISTTTGAADTITATLTLANPADGSISGLTNIGGGSYRVVGDRATVNAALAAAEFVAATPTYPVIINVSIDDGDEDGSGPTTGSILIASTPPATVYVDDGFSGTAGTAITDADGGPATVPATFAYNAFNSLAVAAAVVAPSGTIVVNDGSYPAFNLGTAAPATTLRLTGSGGVAGASTVVIASLDAETTNIIDLGAETLVLGDNSGQNTIECPITGAGGKLTKNGTDRLVLWSVCTYTGTTTVNDGFLRVGLFTAEGLQAELAGDGPVVVNAPGAIEFNVDVDRTIYQTGAIGGDGKVFTMGDGTLVFDGPAANPFSGGLDLGDGANSSWDGASGAKNGFVVANRGDHLGTGKILSRGAQLQAGSPGVVIPNDIDITDGGFRCGGAIDFGFSGQINPIGNTVRGFGNYGLEGLDLTHSGNIDVTNGNMNFEGSNGKNNGTWTISGNISGAGNVNVNAGFDGGVVTLSGTNSYTGTTTLDAVNPPTITYCNATHTGGGSYTVNSGATLAGNGSTTSAVTVNAGGTLAPGTSIGSLATGGLTVAGTLAIEVANTTGTAGIDWDRIVVTGAVNITGATLDVTETGPGVEAAPNPIVVIDNDTAFDAITGSFGAGVPFSGDYRGSGKFGQVLSFGGDGNDLSLVAGGSSIIGAWRLANFANSANLSPGANTDNGDNDPSDNLLEFAFGTNPKAPDGAALSWNGGVGTTVPGGPVVNVQAGPAYFAWFMRRSDFGQLGSVGYTLEFSSDLTDWEVNATAPLVLDTVGSYQLVQVPFPATLSNLEVPRFFRVIVAEIVSP